MYNFYSIKKIFVLLFVAIALSLHAQKPEIKLDDAYKKHVGVFKLTMSDTAAIYVNDGDSKELYYYALVPEHKIRGVLIILPPTGELAEETLNNNSKLASLACDRSIMTVVPSINFNRCLDETALGFLNATFADVIKRFNTPKNKFIIGGFSLGGMNAIRYTEMAYQDSSKTAVKPVAVYGVDPPLDLDRLYHTFLRTIKKNVSEAAVGEARSYTERMESRFGGNPEKNPEKYIYYSMYSRSQPDGGNAKYLSKVPVRIYSDPDIDWYLKNRKSDLYDMNALDQTAMINALNQSGNNRAEYINALGKGYRPDGTRHPHSWSIADPLECINWIIKCFH